MLNTPKVLDLEKSQDLQIFHSKQEGMELGNDDDSNQETGYCLKLLSNVGEEKVEQPKEQEGDGTHVAKD